MKIRLVSLDNSRVLYAEQGDFLKETTSGRCYQILQLTPRTVLLQPVVNDSLTGVSFDVSHDWFVREVYSGRSAYVLFDIRRLIATAAAPVPAPTKWSCGHKKLDTDKHCPVCAAFGRRTTA